MKSCAQFQEMHLVKLLPKMSKVYYVDMQSCCEISFDAAYTLAMEMDSLLFINFEPRDPTADEMYWEILLRHFKTIHFGHSVRCWMPHYGNFWHVPYSSDED